MAIYDDAEKAEADISEGTTKRAIPKEEARTPGWAMRDKRAISGNKEDSPDVEINGTVAGFVPAFDRVLVKRLPKPPEGLIARPEIAQEQAARGVVISVGESVHGMPPVGAVASFSKFAEEKHFADEGADEYALVWNVDIRGWHNA